MRTEKQARVRSCQMKADGLRVLEQWTAQRRALWERRFDSTAAPQS